MRQILLALCAVFVLGACTKRSDEKAARERDEQLMMQKLLEAAETREAELNDAGLLDVAPKRPDAN
jgi:hypothetical protein